MATNAYREPTYVGNGNVKEPFPVPVNLAQNAAFRRGAIVKEATTGTITLPITGGAGTGAGIAGPAASVITTGTSASAGAPAATYYYTLTYNLTGHTNESLQTALGELNVAAGFLPTISVASTGAPFSADHFQVYMGLLPTYLSNQNGSAGTALGSTFTAANPLTNYAGATGCATGDSTNILGMAAAASNETYFDGYGGSFTAGNPGSRLGSTNTIDPLTPTEAPLVYIVTLGNGTIIEMSLNSASGGWSPFLLGKAVGLTLDATTGWYTADTTQTQVGNIIGQRPGVYVGPTAQGNVGETGVRVLVQFLSSVLLIQ